MKYYITCVDRENLAKNISCNSEEELIYVANKLGTTISYYSPYYALSEDYSTRFIIVIEDMAKIKTLLDTYRAIERALV